MNSEYGWLIKAMPYNSKQIRISQIDCDSTWLAPDACTQFFTSTSGTIYSYGYPNELQVTELNETQCRSLYIMIFIQHYWVRGRVRDLKVLGLGPRCVTNFDIFQSQEMTACVRGGQNKCSIDYSVAGGTSPDTFEIAATTGRYIFNTTCHTEK